MLQVGLTAASGLSTHTLAQVYSLVYLAYALSRSHGRLRVLELTRWLYALMWSIRLAPFASRILLFISLIKYATLDAEGTWIQRAGSGHFGSS